MLFVLLGSLALAASPGRPLSWQAEVVAIEVPVQIIRSGRRRVWKPLAWRPQLPIFFRLLDAL